MLTSTSTAAAIAALLLSFSGSVVPEDTCVSPGQPASGQLGTRVTIHGTNLLGKHGGTDIVEVKLAGEKVRAYRCLTVVCVSARFMMDDW